MRLVMIGAGILALASAGCSSGPSCQQVYCDPYCPAGQFCNESFRCEDLRECATPCTTSEICDPTTGRCVPTCNPPCVVGICVDGVCEAPPCPEGCPAGEVCTDSGECEELPVCDPVCDSHEACMN